MTQATNTKINLKAKVFAICEGLYENETHYLRPVLLAMFNGEYLASKRFADKLIGEVLSATSKVDPNGITVNLIGESVVGDKDSIRRYTHEWRKKKMRQIEAAKAQANQVVTQE